jgi:O-antigen/teichoic acid export membrane protein
MGELQGEERFATMSLLMVGQSALKLVASFGVGLRYGAAGFLVGLAFASLVAYWVLVMLLRRKLAVRVHAPWLGNALKYLAIVLPSTLALSLLLSTDVLLVKHLFNGQAAGEYSAVGALGRAIFWGASGVAAVLFPKAVFREAHGVTGLRLVGFSVGLVGIGGVAGLAVLSVGSRLILGGFAGRAYLGGATYLPWYAIAMTLLGCAAILIATHQSRAGRAFLVVLIPVALAEPVGILAFHQSLTQVVEVVTVTMAVLVAGLAIVLVRQPVRQPTGLMEFVPIAQA